MRAVLRKWGAVALVFAVGIAVGWVAAKGKRSEAAPERKAAPVPVVDAERIIVSHPDPAGPGGRRDHVLHVVPVKPVSADKQPPNVWLVTLVPPDGAPVVTIGGEER